MAKDTINPISKTSTLKQTQTPDQVTPLDPNQAPKPSKKVTHTADPLSNYLGIAAVSAVLQPLITLSYVTMVMKQNSERYPFFKQILPF
jgi:hypothetical protein